MENSNSRTFPTAVTVAVLAVSLCCVACGPDSGTVQAPPANGITALEPASAVAGSGDLTVRILGTELQRGGHVRSIAVWFDGQRRIPLETSIVSKTELTAVVPAALLATPGAYAIRVEFSEAMQGSPMGRTGEVRFIVEPPACAGPVDPRSGECSPRPEHPVLVQLDPSSIAAGHGDLPVRLIGSGLISSRGHVEVRVIWSGTVRRLLTLTSWSDSELTAVVPADLLTSPSSAKLSVDMVDVQDSEAVYGRSNSLAFTVLR